MIIGIALSTTALGTILPVLRDAGEAGTPLGTVVTAVGAVGEFAPMHRDFAVPRRTEALARRWSS